VFEHVTQHVFLPECRAHGQDFGHQAVELIETAPGTAGRQTFEDVAWAVTSCRSCLYCLVDGMMKFHGVGHVCRAALK